MASEADMPPGTELMRNTTNHQTIEFPDSHQVLVPTPSDDLADPLNWRFPRKLSIIVVQAFYVLFSILPTLSIAPVTPIFLEDFHTDEATVSLFLGVAVITLGYMNFILVPFSNIFGRRATCLITAAIVVGGNIWLSLARGTGSFLGARVFNAIGAAANETVMVQVIADIFFLHERGQWMGVYFAAYFLGCFVGPIIAGNMAQALGWRSFFWLCTGISSLNFFSLLFLFPETKYHRKTSVYDSTDAQNSSTEAKGQNLGIISAEIPPSPNVMRALGNGRTENKQWKLIQNPYPNAVSSLLRDIVTPVYSLSFPIIAWTVFVVEASANTLLAMNLTQSPVFAAPPYHFTPGEVGFVNFAFVVGGLIGMITAGPLSDWVAKRLTVRNNDLREPEMRLWAMIPYFVAMVLGCIVIILGYHNQWPWQAIVVFGYTCIGLQVVALPTIAVAYEVDCYKPISGEILVICTVFKNTVGFSMAYWVQDLTPANAVLVLFATNAGACLLGIPIYIFGKSLRKFSRNSAVHSMEIVM
jgi:MFS family permease